MNQLRHTTRRETLYMNAQQMKSAISRFRKADVSAIKDAKLRAKAQKLQAKQAGFTLLELLVVITLLATLATAGLVAYEGIGENAQDTAAAQNLVIAESSIRNYRAIEDEYPNQWDNLVNVDGTLPITTGVQPLLDDTTEDFIGAWTTTLPATFAGTSIFEAVADALEAVGMDEFQTLDPTTTYGANGIPNLSWNESAPDLTAGGADELEFVFTGGALSDVNYGGVSQLGNAVSFSIVPASNGTACTADGATLANDLAGNTVTDSSVLNLINDAIDDDLCTMVIALGFGKDVPGTTLGSRVGISQVPTAATENVNPAEDYARYIALFQVAADDDNSGTIDLTEVFNRARLIGVTDPEGRIVDTALAGANEDA
jgi:prepilin-type N-terminal cleavage/methylation domain-containing protein